MNPCKSKTSDRETWRNCTKLDLYSKNIYNPIVKVTDWERYNESAPIDTNPYCPTAFDLHFSHYNKLGGDRNPVNYTTTTQDMLNQIFTRRRDLEVKRDQPLISLVSDIYQPNENEKPMVCCSPFGADFISTMKHSFQPPYPYLLKRLSMAEPPYFLHRFLKGRDSCKFLDDDYVLHTQRLQTHKRTKHISYDPCTGYYTDGTLGNTRDIY